MTTQHDSTPEAQVSAPFISKPVAPADFDNEIWPRCEPVRISQYWSGEQAPPERQAEARLCWSNQGLLVRFACTQREPLVVAKQPVIDRKTIGLWDRDVCEIFLAPNSDDSSRYFEFEAAPTGEFVDL